MRSLACFGSFRARCHHASVAPKSTAEHLKIAYFFRKSEQGERRAKRALAVARSAVPDAADGADENADLAQARQVKPGQAKLSPSRRRHAKPSQAKISTTRRRASQAKPSQGAY